MVNFNPVTSVFTRLVLGGLLISFIGVLIVLVINHIFIALGVGVVGIILLASILYFRMKIINRQYTETTAKEIFY